MGFLISKTFWNCKYFLVCFIVSHTILSTFQILIHLLLIKLYYEINTIIIINTVKIKLNSLPEVKITWHGSCVLDLGNTGLILENYTSWLKFYLFKLPSTAGSKLHDGKFFSPFFVWVSHWLHCVSRVGTLIQALTWRRIYSFTLLSFQHTMPLCFWNFVILCISGLSFETEKNICHFDIWRSRLCHLSLLSFVLGSKSGKVWGYLAWRWDVTHNKSLLVLSCCGYRFAIFFFPPEYIYLMYLSIDFFF